MWALEWVSLVKAGDGIAGMIVEACETNCLELEIARVGVHEHGRGEEVRYEEF